MTANREVRSFFDPATNTITHVVSDPATKRAAVIDSVMDYEPHAAALTHESADAVIRYVEDASLAVDWILETHVHADHVSAAPYLKAKLGGKTGIGAAITQVQDVFAGVFGEGPGFARDGSQFDVLFNDGDTFAIGSLEARVIATPGHTPADVSYLVGDAAFVGDTLFMSDYGTARCDFPGGDAGTLFDSIQKLYALPDETRMLMCHDYLPAGRTEYAWETTVGEEKRSNVHVRHDTDRASFVKARTERDRTLAMPRLIIPSVQANMRAGNLPAPDEDGISRLSVPVNGAFAKIA